MGGVAPRPPAAPPCPAGCHQPPVEVPSWRSPPAGSYRPLGDIVRPHVGRVRGRLLARPGGRRRTWGSLRVSPSTALPLTRSPPQAQDLQPPPCKLPCASDALSPLQPPHPPGNFSGCPCPYHHPRDEQAGSIPRQQCPPGGFQALYYIQDRAPPNFPTHPQLSYGAREPPAPWRGDLEASKLETRPQGAPTMHPAHFQATTSPQKPLLPGILVTHGP